MLIRVGNLNSKAKMIFFGKTDGWSAEKGFKRLLGFGNLLKVLSLRKLFSFIAFKLS